MKFGALDTQFPSLTFHCLVFYWVVCIVTLGITVGSVVRQVGVYKEDCSLSVASESNSSYYSTYGDVPNNVTYYDGIPINPGCIPGDIAIFALGLAVAVLAMIQSSLYLVLFYQHRLSPLKLCVSNCISMVLWIVVIAIGWDPTSWSYDDSTGTAAPNISGWLYTYSSYWASESATYGVGTTLALDMGFAVMSIISFGLSTLLALYAFIVHHRNSRKKRPSVEEALVIPPILTEKKSSNSAALASNVAASHGDLMFSDDRIDTGIVRFSGQGGMTRSRSL